MKLQRHKSKRPKVEKAVPIPLSKKSKQLSAKETRQLMEFSQLLHAHLREARLSPMEVARVSGLQDETVRSYLRGIIRPSKRSLARLCMLFGPELAAPFEQTELAGAAARAVEVLPINDNRVVLRMELVLPVRLVEQILDLLRKEKLVSASLPVVTRGELINKVVTQP